MEQIGLSQAIANIRAELTDALIQGADDAIKFEVGSVELELELALTVAAGVKAEARWIVVSLGGDAKGERASSHRIKLVLIPTHKGGKLEISSSRPVTR